MDWLGGGEGVFASCNYFVDRGCIFGFGGEDWWRKKKEERGVGGGGGGEASTGIS